MVKIAKNRGSGRGCRHASLTPHKMCHFGKHVSQAMSDAFFQLLLKQFFCRKMFAQHSTSL